MEKHELKLKSKIMKIFPKLVTLTFQNPPFSPGHHHKPHHHSHGVKGFSGPMIPFEARRNLNSNNDQEPTSPKISCMGQIKHKKKQPKKATSSYSTSRDIEVKKHVTKFQKMLSHVGKQKTTEGRRKSDASASHNNNHALEERVPPNMSQIKRFSSGRDTFANFDWKTQVVPQEIDYYSDNEDRVQSDTDDNDDEDEEIKISFSAPLYVGGVLNLKPRKEINLWKRRTMAPPIPLQLDPVI